LHLSEPAAARMSLEKVKHYINLSEKKMLKVPLSGRCLCLNIQHNFSLHQL